MGRSAVLVPEVVRQHAEEAVTLFMTRAGMTTRPHVRLGDLRRLDDRLAAHVDGLSVAGEGAWPFCQSALELPSRGRVCMAVVWALQNARSRLAELLALSQTDRAAFEGITSAFEWVEPGALQGVVSELLAADDSTGREAAIAACAAHRVDPGPGFERWLTAPESSVRARALRAAGEVGRRDLLTACARAMSEADGECRFWGTWSAVLLGDRQQAVECLTQEGTTESPHRARAFRLSLQARGVAAGHELLRAIAHDPQQLRWTIHGSGIVGDVTYVPWLIGHLRSDETCRLAGEAFSLITGLDLSQAGFSRPAPDEVATRPNGNPDDANVDVHQDEKLPWPDPDRVQHWWDANGPRFRPGERYFAGSPLTTEHCVDVLTSGYQRQRILAAHYLCLLNPGTPLFNTSAPAWRQQRLLSDMK
jgi:uncharacterized protein (TIGR02270 family)